MQDAATVAALRRQGREDEKGRGIAAASGSANKNFGLDV
jgi:hypothetical protein